MQSQTFEGSTLEPLSFSLQMSSYTFPAMQTANAALLNRQHSYLAERALDTRGFLRGFCWAITIEALVALCAYEAWHLWLFLR